VKRLSIAFAILIVLGGAAGSAVFYAMRLLEPVDPNASPQPFEVHRGEGLKRIARSLEQAGLVRDARAVEWYARLNELDAKIQAGEYELSAAWSTRSIVGRLTSGRVVTYPVVLPEGIRATEVAARLEAAELVGADDFLALVEDADFTRSLGIEADRLEGYLYPETYRLPRGLPPERVARVLVAEFQAAWAKVEPLAREQGMTQHQVVTLASIVEKETAAPEERPLIAAVFRNRMERGMRLETDPTVIYGIAGFDGNLRRKHLLDGSNPYNTYKIKGLPPGPIANPGIDALRAVVEPAESDYLFFVSRNDGTHHFSRTYREHTNAVNRYQKRRRSR
jgi:UPF0755 protein